jgi:hypothetical protein
MDKVAEKKNARGKKDNSKILVSCDKEQKQYNDKK